MNRKAACCVAELPQAVGFPRRPEGRKNLARSARCGIDCAILLPVIPSPFALHFRTALNKVKVLRINSARNLLFRPRRRSRLTGRAEDSLMEKAIFEMVESTP